MGLQFGKRDLVVSLVLWFALIWKAQANYVENERNKNLWGPGLHFRRRLFLETTPPVTPVCIQDLTCFVCSEEDDIGCGYPDTPSQYLKSCKTLIPCSTAAFGPSSENPNQSYLCYKTFDPYTRKLSRSCQTTASLPEYVGASSTTGCTTSRHINPAGKIGTRCICNMNGCNNGSIYIPPNDYSKGYTPISIPFLIIFLGALNLLKVE
ncbi:hypothetical protein Ocin01_01178 [Orchesella cincta]|uniref:Protein sleepless n=1 Tax=Orchesella cincta TaxID=48709 RepID=A0A1D2NJN7_ORCCI|nr:hypothetical protein Ocin01_01178 [Orchesella cincta]